ncbi:MAG: phospholipase [Acidobacteria bacterium]|nr:phospholipase [Acidobacteriota bacterium]
MAPQARSIEIPTHGHYWIQVPHPGKASPLLVGFHGYGENAERNLRQLQGIPGSERWLLVSIQGLHLFYERKSNEVVASWMTRLGRENAIRDNIRYVDSVLSEIKKDYASNGCLVYAGFSQGVAMACRAAAFVPHTCHGLLLLGSDVPPEIKANPTLSFPPILLARGRHDAWYTQAKMDEDLLALRSKSSRLVPMVFEGGHEWGEPFRKAAGDFLSRVMSSQ